MANLRAELQRKATGAFLQYALLRIESALVIAGTQVPPGSLILGSPAKVVRELDKDERNEGTRLAAKYVSVAQRSKARGQSKTRLWEHSSAGESNGSATPPAPSATPTRAECCTET